MVVAVRVVLYPVTYYHFVTMRCPLGCWNVTDFGHGDQIWLYRATPSIFNSAGQSVLASCRKCKHCAHVDMKGERPMHTCVLFKDRESPCMWMYVEVLARGGGLRTTTHPNIYDQSTYIVFRIFAHFFINVLCGLRNKNHCNTATK